MNLGMFLFFFLSLFLLLLPVLSGIESGGMRGRENNDTNSWFGSFRVPEEDDDAGRVLSFSYDNARIS